MEEEEEEGWANRWLLLPSGRFQCNLIVRLLFAPLSSSLPIFLCLAEACRFQLHNGLGKYAIFSLLLLYIICATKFP